MISEETCESLVKNFIKCVTLRNCLYQYSHPDVWLFFETVQKAHQKYYLGKVDIFRSTKSILGILIIYELNKTIVISELALKYYYCCQEIAEWGL